MHAAVSKPYATPEWEFSRSAISLESPLFCRLFTLPGKLILAGKKVTARRHSLKIWRRFRPLPTRILRKLHRIRRRLAQPFGNPQRARTSNGVGLFKRACDSGLADMTAIGKSQPAELY